MLLYQETWYTTSQNREIDVYTSRHELINSLHASFSHFSVLSNHIVAISLKSTLKSLSKRSKRFKKLSK